MRVYIDTLSDTKLQKPLHLVVYDRKTTTSSGIYMGGVMRNTNCVNCERCHYNENGFMPLDIVV